MMIHARGYSAVIGDNTHIYRYEAGAMSTIGNIFPRPVKN